MKTALRVFAIVIPLSAAPCPTKCVSIEPHDSLFGNIDDPKSWHVAAKQQDAEYAAAWVYRLAGKIRKVALSVSDESGDWGLYVTYCFREDGGIARREEHLRTFFGKVIRDRVLTYDCKGAVLKETVKFEAMNGEHLKSAPDDFYPRAAPDYPNVAALPFK